MPDAWLVDSRHIRSPVPGSVAVWVLDMRVLPDDFRGAELLMPDEFRRAEEFRDPPARRRFGIARWATRRLVAAATGLSAREVHWRAEPGGKPVLEAPEWEVNWSHDGPWLAVALGYRTPVGVDIAGVFEGRPWDRLARRYGSMEEAERILADEDVATAFLGMWTRKEALLKATGEGIRRRLSGLCVIADEPLPGWWVADGPAPEAGVRVATSWSPASQSVESPRWHRLEAQAQAWVQELSGN